MSYLVAIAWCALIAFLIVRAAREQQAFEEAAPGGLSPEDRAPFVAVVVPARNEEARIGDCLDGLLGQRYPAERYRIAVVDDCSDDATADLVRARLERSDRLHLIESEELPNGWAGKPHACFRGASSEAAAGAEWLCFVDADTVAEPEFLATIVASAHGRSAALLSFAPLQELRTFWERTFMPAGFLMLAFTQNMRRFGDAASDDAAVNGQCLLVRRDAYDAVGGHAAVAAEVCEDTALARRMKRRGYGIALLSAHAIVRTRLYDDFAGLRDGLGKNIVETLGGPHKTLGAVALAFVLALGAPGLAVWAAARGGPPLVALLGTFALLGVHLATARRLQVPIGYAFLFPFGYAIGAYIALRALVERSHRGVSWKGRTYRRLRLAEGEATGRGGTWNVAWNRSAVEGVGVVSARDAP
ncbi:MAG: glycosyltransferase [Candidatus Eremiobacteraeota bacterium]|nr:glycosyltransferase [Candidatus Eremiobacteraeota bacterium]